jgi:hypothetical protein
MPLDSIVVFPCFSTSCTAGWPHGGGVKSVYMCEYGGHGLSGVGWRGGGSTNFLSRFAIDS